jgi:hypothetical protein
MPGSGDFELEIAEILDTVIAPLQEEGLFTATNIVQRVTLTQVTPGRPTAGRPAVNTETKVEIGNGVDIPYVEIEWKEVTRWIDGGLTKIGDAKAKISIRALTLAQLTSAAWYEIDGVKYTLIDGEIKKVGTSWIVVFRRW